MLVYVSAMLSYVSAMLASLSAMLASLSAMLAYLSAMLAYPSAMLAYLSAMLAYLSALLGSLRSNHPLSSLLLRSASSSLLSKSNSHFGIHRFNILNPLSNLSSELLKNCSNSLNNSVFIRRIFSSPSDLSGWNNKRLFRKKYLN